MAFTKTHQKRLLNVAKALRESKRPSKFTMETFVHGDDGPMTGKEKNFCGTPACALGHYGAREDLQKVMKIKITQTTDYVWNASKQEDVEVPALEAALVYKRGDRRDANGSRGPNGSGTTVFYTDPRILEHFGIDYNEADELFGGYGCGHAETPKEAAKYIEQFVKEKAAGQR